MYFARDTDGSDRRIAREAIDKGSDVQGRAIACTLRAIVMVVIGVSRER